MTSQSVLRPVIHQQNALRMGIISATVPVLMGPHFTRKRMRYKFRQVQFFVRRRTRLQNWEISEHAWSRDRAPVERYQKTDEENLKLTFLLPSLLDQRPFSEVNSCLLLFLCYQMYVATIGVFRRVTLKWADGRLICLGWFSPLRHLHMSRLAISLVCINYMFTQSPA